jgi:hypothetical protein
VDLVDKRRVAEGILVKACPRLGLSRLLAVIGLAIGLATNHAAAQTFYPDDPLPREPTPLPAPDPGRRNLSVLLEAAAATFGRPGERHPGNGVIAAQGVNTLGEVLDGAWYVNRHGRTRMSAEELRRGSGNDQPPSTTGPWHVLLLKNDDVRPTIVFRDENNRVYRLRFDSRGAPELATGAEMISSRFFHALGYHVPETYLAMVDRERLVVETNATEVTSNAGVRPLLSRQIDRLLAGVERRTDGRYRATVLKVPTEAISLVGPYQLFGTRSDDPNDIVPHEHRRDLRGLYVFAAWLNHTHMDALHTFDIVAQREGEPPYIRHYLLDFMATLGSGLSGQKAVWEGHDPVYGQKTTLQNIAGFGLYTPAWMRASYPDLPAVGRLESETFEPGTWTPLYDLAPFANRLPDDTFWAARQVMAFTDDDIRAIVQVAQYSNPAVDRWIADCLIDRRNRIGRVYLTRVLPLDDIAVRGTELAYVDLAAQYKFAEPRPFRVDWAMFDNKAGKPAALLATTEGHQIPPEASGVPDGSYVLAHIRMDGTSAGTAVNVVLRRETSGLRVVGIDREWPGRVLVDPRTVARPVRNRYIELDSDRQRLFDTYARELNARLGENQSPEERFRALSVSEQTTFDAVSHALLQSTLSNEARQPLGRALDLVIGLARIAGESAGRGTDQQFRIYVTLRPDARDVLERSREFERSHENTIYHVGYPHTYRQTSGLPSIQFSIAEDGLSADIDVDYRASKAPQSLFNGHLTSSNSDVRAGDNSERHTRRWSGFADWWSDVFGGVTFGDGVGAADSALEGMPTRLPSTVPPNRPLGAAIPDVAVAAQEFLTDWLIRRNYQEAAAFFAPDVLPCIADSMDMNPKTPQDRLRRASLDLLERAANQWGRPTSLTEAMNPVVPWRPAVRIVKHAFDQDFTIVEAPTELGSQYECGATPPKTYTPSTEQHYGTYYGTVLQVVRERKPGGTLVLVWRRVNNEWRLVAYRAVD